MIILESVIKLPSIETLQSKYNLSSELLSSWRQSVSALGTKDFYTSELHSDYPDRFIFLAGPHKDGIRIKTGFDSIPEVYQKIFDYLISGEEVLPYALIMQNHYLYWLYVQEPQIVTDTRGIPHNLGCGVPAKNEELSSTISAQTAVVDLDDMDNWKNILHANYDYHIDQKGLWRVDIPDEITGDFNNF